jgi:hypothetical protein
LAGGFARQVVLVATLGLGAAALAASGACTKSGASLGQSCLTDQDCFSGSCSQQICVAAAPVLDAEAKGDSPAVVVDASGDGAGDAGATVEGGDSSRADASLDAFTGDAPSEGAPAETGPADAPIDSPADADMDSEPDAPPDAGSGG